jgi:aspartyl-tRNA(Asn)/glutamyl-tRNA(Gln) amidotransferase subunit A
MSEPIWKLEPHEIADLVTRGDVSAKEVVEVFLERIEAFNSELNAFVYLDPDKAREEAMAVDRSVARGEPVGPLAGIPIGVKDLEDAAGMPTTHGSVIHKDNIAEHDSIQVSRLRAAGCVVVGKTAAPEFGASTFTSTKLHGTTRNPWDLSRTPGGSSGGSAAAVAAALVPIATGSDGGGSIRIPASFSGLLGMKGTFGRVPRGRAPESSYTSVYGPMARSVQAAARYLDCVVGSDERDHFSLPSPGVSYEDAISRLPDGLRAAWTSDLGYVTCAAEVEQIARGAAEKLGKSCGFGWVDRRIELKDGRRAWRILGAEETWLRHSPYWPGREKDLDPLLALGMRLLEELKVPDKAEANRLRWENDQILADAFNEIDLIITPTMPTVAFAAEGPMPSHVDGKKIHVGHSFGYTFPFNISGHPAVTIPCGFDTDGLPVGLHVVGRRHEDHLLLAVAAAYERDHPWPRIASRFDEPRD